MEFRIENTTGIRIKSCNKYETKIKVTVNNAEKETIEISAENTDDFQIIVNELSRGDYNFKFEIVEGKFDLEYILYEK